VNIAFNQLKKQWQIEGNIIEVEITENDIMNGITWFGRTYSKNVIKAVLTNGTTEAEKEKYYDIMKYFYKKKIKAKLNINNYHVIYVPSGMGIAGFASEVDQQEVSFISPPGTSSNFTVPHELGHNLDLNHIGVDLGQCDDNQIRIVRVP
jgi:hypothetical protein